MAFSWLLCMSTVDACGGAGATEVGMASSVGAMTMVLVVGMLSATNRADYHFLALAAALCCMVERPATLTLLNEGTRYKLMDVGLMPKHKRRITGQVL